MRAGFHRQIFNAKISLVDPFNIESEIAYVIGKLVKLIVNVVKVFVISGIAVIIKLLLIVKLFLRLLIIVESIVLPILLVVVRLDGVSTGVGFRLVVRGAIRTRTVGVVYAADVAVVTVSKRSVRTVGSVTALLLLVVL